MIKNQRLSFQDKVCADIRHLTGLLEASLLLCLFKFQLPSDVIIKVRTNRIDVSKLIKSPPICFNAPQILNKVISYANVDCDSHIRWVLSEWCYTGFVIKAGRSIPVVWQRPWRLFCGVQVFARLRPCCSDQRLQMPPSSPFYLLLSMNLSEFEFGRLRWSRCSFADGIRSI